MKTELNENKLSLDNQLNDDLVAIIQSAVKDALANPTKYGSAYDSTSTLDLHLGEPSDQQLEVINGWCGTKTKKSDWFVVPLWASDNLVNRSFRKWHPNVLQQMEMGFPGGIFMLNHDWDGVESAIGFVFDARLVTSMDAAASVINQPGKAEFNRYIIGKEGCKTLYLWCAVSKNLQSVVEGISTRRLDDCSTGGMLSNVRMICPICTEKCKREVTFWESDDEGENVCPHSIPWGSSYLAMDDEDEDEDEPECAPYMILDGNFESVEISMVQLGNLPAASVVRGM